MTENKDGTVSMTTKELTERADHDYALGISAGWHNASVDIMKRAQELFLEGNDVGAQTLRSLSLAIELKAQDLHPGASR